MNNNIYPVWIEISRTALKNNIDELKNTLKKNKNKAAFCGVVKANAYGHGLIETAEIIEKDVDWFGVNALWEAVKIIEKLNTHKPIIVLGYTPLNALETLVKYPNIRIIAYNMETLEKLDKLAEANNVEMNVHIKVETGTGRQGITENQISEFAAFFKKSGKLKLEGLSTHFANIEKF